MAWSFDEVDDYVLIGDAPELDLPDSDWTMTFWMNFTDNAGSGFQYFLSRNTVNASNSFNGYIGEESSSAANFLRGAIEDAEGDGAFGSNLSGGIAPDSGNWHHFTYVRFSDVLYVLRDSLVEDSHAPTNFGAVNPANDLYVGARNDLNSARFFGGQIAEFAKWNKFLSTEERAALVAGYSPLFFQDDLSFYVPMVREYEEVVAGLSVANNGSTISKHPPIIYPNGIRT